MRLLETTSFLFLFVTNGYTWTNTHDRPGQGKDISWQPSRRNFLFSCAVPMMILPKSTLAADDPFAQMDSFASSSFSGETSSATSLSTGNGKPKTDNDTTKEQVSKTAMDLALEESRKRKKVDPRTHG